MTRHGLLLTAVATVTVPGLLAMLAVAGHEHVTPKAGAAAVALDGAAQSGPFPVAPSTARTAVRNNVAAVQRASGAPVTVLSRVTTSQQEMGTSLLDKSATAVQSTSYQGTELLSQSGLVGRVKMVSRVWHQGGGVTLVQTSNDAITPASRSAIPSNAATTSPEGVFGVTKPLVALIGKHYVAVYRGKGSAVGRKSEIVELYRFDGSLAARYWLDGQTMVPLRRQLFDTADNQISDDSFVQVKFGAAVAKLAGPAAAQALPASALAWIAAVPASRFLASLADQGWQVPATQPGGLPLYAAASAKTSDGEVAELEYSDGLYVVSLFVQRGALAPNMPGWRRAGVAGQQAFVSGYSVTWAGLGFVYTVIADAPPQTVTQVVKDLPRNGPPGVLDRLGRGFTRIARVINPFG